MFFIHKASFFLLFIGSFVYAKYKWGEKVNKDFYISIDRANYHQAFVNCKQGDMELASIENEDVSAAIDKFLEPNKTDGTRNGFWLSGTNLPNTNSTQYYWLSTGERVIYTNWLPDQPDNLGGIEHCMQWVYFTTLNRSGWNDWQCNDTLRYVCEYIKEP